MLAHVSPHSVIGLTLSPIDANNSFFIILVGLSGCLEKKVLFDGFHVAFGADVVEGIVWLIS